MLKIVPVRPSLVELKALPRRGYKLRPKQRTCGWCKAPLKGRQRVCCGQALCKKMTKSEVRRHPAAGTIQKRGLQCQSCGAFDSETPFKTLTNCAECDRQRYRVGICEQQTPPNGDPCGTILASEKGLSYCPRCCPPRYWIEVLWVNHEDQRLRTVYRALREGYVSLGGQRFPVRTNPLRVVVPTKSWLSVRR